jgi:hypothetical protein
LVANSTKSSFVITSVGLTYPSLYGIRSSRNMMSTHFLGAFPMVPVPNTARYSDVSNRLNSSSRGVNTKLGLLACAAAMRARRALAASGIVMTVLPAKLAM